MKRFYTRGVACRQNNQVSVGVKTSDFTRLQNAILASLGIAKQDQRRTLRVPLVCHPVHSQVDDRVLIQIRVLESEFGSTLSH